MAYDKLPVTQMLKQTFVKEKILNKNSCFYYIV